MKRTFFYSRLGQRLLIQLFIVQRRRIQGDHNFEVSGFGLAPRLPGIMDCFPKKGS